MIRSSVSAASDDPATASDAVVTEHGNDEKSATAGSASAPQPKPAQNRKGFFRFLKKNAVCVIAFLLALVTSFIVPPDKEYLGYLALSSAHKEKYMPFTFIMQNIAANLGGMLTPFGNPQNLYLYGKFNIPTGEFTLIMLPPFLLSVCAIVLCCVIFVKKEPLSLSGEKPSLDKKRLCVYLALFALAIVMVFRIIPYYIGLAVIIAALFLLDKKALKNVDYALLFTFVFFFIFAGNTARIPVVRESISKILAKNTLLFSVLSCQFISNVPSAILLSEFTGDYKSLLLGVNIGGVGTLISSLASLITFREYTAHYPEKTKNYLALFSAFNFAFLTVLTVFCSFLV